MIRKGKAFPYIFNSVRNTQNARLYRHTHTHTVPKRESLHIWEMGAGGERLVPLSFTFVQYRDNDNLGRVLAYACLSPMVILVALATLILFRRELRTASLLGGIVVSEGINFVLKNAIREPRPTPEDTIGAEGPSHHFTMYGMPSSHAQFMAFFASYMVAFLYHRVVFKNAAWRHLLALCAIASAATVCVGRVHLHYHTKNQVIAGASLGAFLGVLWYLFTEIVLLRRVFPAIERMPLAEYFYVKDSSHIGNVFLFEYLNSRAKSRNARRAGSKAAE